MKKIIAMILVTGLTLSMIACSADNAPTGDANAETAETVTEETGETKVAEESQASDETEKSEPVEINLDNPGDDINNMILLMDALNIASVETTSVYDDTNPEYVWHAIHVALCNSDFPGISFEDDELYLCVPKDFVEEIYHTMFSSSEKMLDVPEEETGGDYPSIKIDDNNYYFMFGDRGLSDYTAYDSTVYESGDIILSVRLFSPEYDLDTEIYSGNYWMFPCDDTDSYFKYDIYQGGPANDFSDDKIKGGVSIGYYTYDDGSYYEEGEAKSNMRMDIPYFVCLDDEKTGVTELNNRIVDELYCMTDDLYTDYNYDVTWLEIYTERYSSDDYVQAVTTAIEYPNYATDGIIHSYNYDVKNNKAMTNQDGLDLTSFSEEKLYEIIEDKYKEEINGDVYNHSRYMGFRVLDDGNVDYYFIMYIDNDIATERNEIWVYHSKDGSMGKYNQ